MELYKEAHCLRVYAGEADKLQGRPLWEAVLEEARSLGLAGATVFRGAAGFGANSLVHTSKVLRLSMDLPVVVEMVDTMEKLEPMLTFLDEHISEGLVTVQRAGVVFYRHNEGTKRS